MIAKDTKPRCTDCGRITDRLAYYTGTPIWTCAECEYVHFHPDATRVKRPRVRKGQAEALFEVNR